MHHVLLLAVELTIMLYIRIYKSEYELEFRFRRLQIVIIQNACRMKQRKHCKEVISMGLRKQSHIKTTKENGCCLWLNLDIRYRIHYINGYEPEYEVRSWPERP
jgi:hypothetical protein